MADGEWGGGVVADIRRPLSTVLRWWGGGVTRRSRFSLSPDDDRRNVRPSVNRSDRRPETRLETFWARSDFANLSPSPVGRRGPFLPTHPRIVVGTTP